MPREQWSSGPGFVLASIGSAVGIGNIAFGTVGMVVAGVILSVSAGWFFDTRAVLEHLRLGPAWRRAFLKLVRYFIPLALSANLVARLAGRG